MVSPRTSSPSPARPRTRSTPPRSSPSATRRGRTSSVVRPMPTRSTCAFPTVLFLPSFPRFFSFLLTFLPFKLAVLTQSPPLSSNTTVDSPFKTSADEVAPDSRQPAASIDASIDKTFFISGHVRLSSLSLLPFFPSVDVAAKVKLTTLNFLPPSSPSFPASSIGCLGNPAPVVVCRYRFGNRSANGIKRRVSNPVMRLPEALTKLKQLPSSLHRVPLPTRDPHRSAPVSLLNEEPVKEHATKRIIELTASKGGVLLVSFSFFLSAPSRARQCTLKTAVYAPLSPGVASSE